MAGCRNCGQECHPYYAKKYGGFCFECANVGVPELIEERDEARAERDAARRVLLSIAERLAAASEVIGRRAYRKEQCECIPKR